MARRRPNVPNMFSQNKPNFGVGDLTRPGVKAITDGIKESRLTQKVITETIEKLKNDPTKQHTVANLEKAVKEMTEKTNLLEDKNMYQYFMDMTTNASAGSIIALTMFIFLMVEFVK